MKSLQAFVRTVERGSLTEAAQDLALSQPAVTKHLQTLERYVSTRLLERSSRTVRPTSEGLALYEASHEALATIEAALESVQMNMTKMEGTIRVSSPTCLGAKQLQQLIINFQEAHPNIRVQFILDNRQVDLVGGGFDVAFLYEKPQQQGAIVRKIGVVKRILVASPEYLGKVGAIDSVERLAEINFVMTTSTFSANEVVTLCSNGDPIEITVKPFFRSNNAQVIIDNLLIGRGVGPVQSILVSHELASGALTRVLPDHEIPSSELYVTYPSARLMRPVVRSFIDFITPRLQQIDGIERP